MVINSSVVPTHFRDSAMPRLLVNPGTPQQWEIALKPGANTLGRSPACDAQVDHESVSGTHCQVTVSGEKVAVKDLGSTNGTFLNRAPIQEAVLTPGQRLQLGGVEMELAAEAPRAAARPVVVRLAASANAAAAGATVTASASPAAATPLPPPPVVRLAAHETAPPPPSAPGGYVPDEYSAEPEGPAMCKYHPKSAARYLCPHCQLHFCELCVATRPGGERTGRFCRRCSAECVAMNVQLAAPVDRHANFFGSVPEAFLFPFQGNGAYLVVAGSVAFALLDALSTRAMGMGFFIKAMGAIVHVIATGYLFAFLQKVTHTAAQGSDEPVSWPDLTDLSQDVLLPFFQLAATLAVSFAPALAVLMWAGVDAFSSGNADAVKLLLGGAAVLGGIVYFPMALLAVTMLDTILAANPLLVLPSILRVPLEYLLVLVLFAVIFAVRIGGALAARFIYVPVLSELVVSFVGLYFLTVQMRLLGLMYYARRDKLGWFNR
jgi:hypothetical protein